jgi:serine/threonine-protein kinase
MDLLEGQTLAERSLSHPPMSLEETLSIGAQVADILACAHRQGLWHGEVKPSHVFLCRGGSVKLLDFDLAPSTGATQGRDIPIGSVVTMAPEQAAGHLEGMGPSSDVYSLGALLYGLLSGGYPHRGRTAEELLTLIRSVPAPSLGSVAPELPEQVCTVVDRALAFDPGSRPKDAGELGQQLRSLQGPMGDFTAASAPSGATSVRSAATAEMTQDTYLAVDPSALTPVVADPAEAGTPVVADPIEAISAPLVGQTTNLVGSVLADRYQVDRHMGSGGMGSVYQARHVHIKKVVAIKVLHPELSHDPEVVARFEREAVAAARIEHPNVAAAHDFGRLPDGSFFLVLEYVRGTSLRTELERQAPMPVERALGVARQICLALEAAHEAGIVHRDLKPENVMLVGTQVGEEVVKVLDFGIAKVTAEELGGPALTRAGTVFGTPEYMSPEQAAGHPVDARTDLYALGIMLYEMLSGATPFSDDNLVAVLTAQLTQPPPPLPDTVPEPVALLVSRLLAKAVDDRVPTAQQLRAEIDALGPGVRPPSGSKLLDRLGNVGDLPRKLDALRPKVESWIHAVRAHWPPKAWVLRGRRVPGWVVPVVGASALVVLLLTLASPSDSEPSPRPQGLVSRLLENTSAKLQQLTTRAEQGDRAAIAELSAWTPSELGRAQWLSLGRGHALLGDLPKSLSAYGRAIDSEPGLVTDPGLIDTLYRALSQRDDAPMALQFLQAHPSTPGADLLYETWSRLRSSRNKDDREIARQAHTLVGKPSVVGKFSQALKVALDLASARSCSQYRKLLPQAIDHADTRSLTLLRRLTRRSGCGFLRLGDCYGCLRGSGKLSQAIAAAAARPAPTFGPPQEPSKGN